MQHVVRHPDYDDFYVSDDIAVVRVAGEIVFNDYVQPICLPTQNEDVSETGRSCYATGWGAASTTVYGESTNVNKSYPWGIHLISLMVQFIFWFKRH